ncbi:thioesterase II family protein [Kitasatospora viridis]|uniref:Surfactin synthase thioesterase subunit n=1 Tax=Kitasatospora viridis TaxID=281105 RepID=A0A561SFI7_9ACTN|nr:alpha/beta fold hydrolase [Kitasatospora viridis]TWF73636.1 surfactin synthase thioesterase subunit [Kitasatospora viridis]
MSEELWLHRYHPAPAATARLVCFPHAGGSANFWFPLSAALGPDVEVSAVQYPGRQDRRGEPAITDVGQLADALAEVLLPLWSPEPPALLGHSMGALVAYETARRLAERTGHGPRVLVASGRRAPSTARAERALHRAPDAALLAELAGLSGTAPALLADPELTAMILPALRADYRAVETYRHRPGPPLDCPVTVLTGDRDHKVTPAEAAAWSGHTTGPVEVHEYTGGHFFLTEHWAAITALLTERLSTAPAAGPGGPA